MRVPDLGLIHTHKNRLVPDTHETISFLLNVRRLGFHLQSSKDTNYKCILLKNVSDKLYHIHEEIAEQPLFQSWSRHESHLNTQCYTKTRINTCKYRAMSFYLKGHTSVDFIQRDDNMSH